MYLNASNLKDVINIRLFACGEYSEGVYNEHENYFESWTLVKASGMKSIADSNLYKALRLYSLTYEKRFYLLELKSMLIKEL